MQHKYNNPSLEKSRHGQIFSYIGKGSINNAGKIILQDHIELCIVDAVEHGDKKTTADLEKAIDKFI